MIAYFGAENRCYSMEVAFVIVEAGIFAFAIALTYVGAFLVVVVAVGLFVGGIDFGVQFVETEKLQLGMEMKNELRNEFVRVGR
jgi:hypothetical protein